MFFAPKSQIVSYEKLKTVKVQEFPDAGNYWKGCKHSRLVDALLIELGKRNWLVKDMKFVMSPTKGDMVGAFTLDNVNKVKVPKNQLMSIGIYNSNTQERALTLVVGVEVPHHGTGVPFAEIPITMKHTLNADPGESLATALEFVPFEMQEIAHKVEEMRNTVIEDWQVAAYLMEAGRSQPRRTKMPWSRIGQVDSMYRKSTNPKNRTKWYLLNCFASVARKDPPMRQMDEVGKFRELLLSHEFTEELAK